MSDRGSVRIVDLFDAPREVVFAAWTEPERLKQWWGPGFFETVFAQVDLRPGGTSSYSSLGRCGWSESSRK